MKKFLLIILIAIAFSSIVGFSVLSSSGITYASGSPFDSGVTCASCHGGGSASPTSTVTATPAFGPGNTYVAGTTYTVEINCGGYPKYGICLEILNSNTDVAADAGTFGAILSGNCVKSTESGNPTNIIHNAASGTNNKTIFSFEWTAPSGGPVYIYYCLNGVNGNKATSGDKPKAFNMTLTSSTDIPLLTENIINASVFPNPAHDIVSLNYFLQNNTDVNVEILNIEGKKVAAFNYNKQVAGEHHETIHLAELNLTNGLYAVCINTDHYKISKKLIIQ